MAFFPRPSVDDPRVAATLVAVPLIALAVHAIWLDGEGVLLPGAGTLLGAAFFAVWRMARSTRRSAARAWLLLTGVFLAGELIVVPRIRASRARIEEALTSRDPCAPLPSGAEAALKDDQRLDLNARRAKCEAQVRASGCSAIGRGLDGAGLQSADLEWLAAERARLALTADSGAIVQRMAANEPVATDLFLTRADLVCPAEVWPRLVSRVARATPLWSSLEDLGLEMKNALSHEGLSAEAKTALRGRASEVAARALDQERALRTRLCDLALLFRVGDVPACVRPSDADASDSGPVVTTTDTALRQEIRAFQSCVYDCGKQRTPEQKRADDELGQRLLARNRACYAACGGTDAGCVSACQRRDPVGKTSVDDCVSGCQSRYPNWDKPLPP